PLRPGDAHTHDNLQALCGTCHRRKTIEHDGGFGRKSQGGGGSFSTKVVN
ncbi:MAG: HNH endonuclease, partial [Planctomycetes bacterium]|nr:HNH endonuclease [Planctomycetota bacterium]